MSIEDFSLIKTLNKNEAIEAGLLNYVGEEIDDAFINALKSSCLNPEIIKKEAKNVKIVYTPLHGAGNLPVQF